MSGDEIERLARELESGLTRVEQTFARPENELARHVSPQQWCAKQVLGHLIEAEGEVFGALIPGMLGRLAPGEWDHPPSMDRSADCAADTAVLLTRFRVLRGAGVTLARSLKPVDLEVTSARNWHRGPTESVGDLLRHWPEHTAEHLSQATRAPDSPD